MREALLVYRIILNKKELSKTVPLELDMLGRGPEAFVS